MDTLDALPLPAQDRWLLLQGSLQLRVAHLPRVGEWAAVGTAVMVAEDLALQSTGAILGREIGAHDVHAQLTLPRRHGGFCLRHTNHLKGRAAYLSVTATAQRVMAAGPFEGPKGAQLSQQWETLHDVADGLWEADERTADATNMPTIARAQGTFGRYMAQYHVDALLESVDAAAVAGQKTLARLRSCACQASAAWLTALPMAPALELKDAEFCAAMQHRLGMSPLPHNTVGIRCTCAAVPSADDSHHAVTCSSVQGKATMRHDILKGILHQAIHRAGVASTLEPTLRRLPGLEAGAYGASGGTEAAGLEARGDILLALESSMLVLDVSITHPSGVANRRAAATTDGAAATRRDREKGGRTAS
jgi:hypothetical protein